jgi:hypothetical protein
MDAEANAMLCQRARAAPIPLGPPDIYIYQIDYGDPKGSVEGFPLLDNSANERSDWFEYWPIRRFLLTESLAEDAYYGFVSPKFAQKTNLSPALVCDFISMDRSGADVFLFSPSIHRWAYFWNVFQHGDACHPGLLPIAAQFFKRIGKPTNLRELVTHSGNEVSSNYIVAKPCFWRAWLVITERLFQIAESPIDPLGAALRQRTSYGKRRDVQMKVFILERIATWMLAYNSQFTVRARHPFAARSRTYKLPVAIICDALKLAYAAHHNRGYREVFKDVFGLVSSFGKFLNWQIRVGFFCGHIRVRDCLKRLAANWSRTERLR